ncbi:hypothetical protein [Endozoicomonas numazuensis]|uniref:Uncharacterized protein n=1 Tax=Endozoicomonas numazuensis TaxID=1137799 RepID=A0A081NLD5_9GAMM|nr:hypothetical protein [Endozoicomonas numazuensis]KEQ19258.1 hypothetical protein GZ78_04530 [Endozoicomonas numazuensis]
MNGAASGQTSINWKEASRQVMASQRKRTAHARDEAVRAPFGPSVKKAHVSALHMSAELSQPPTQREAPLFFVDSTMPGVPEVKARPFTRVTRLSDSSESESGESGAETVTEPMVVSIEKGLLREFQAPSPCSSNFELFSPVPFWDVDSVEFREVEKNTDLHTSSFNLPDDQKALVNEMTMVLDKARQFSIVDIHQTTKSFRERCQAARNEMIQWQFKELVEGHFPGNTDFDQQMKVMMKAEGARRLKFIRCDDWCFFLLAHWLRSKKLSSQASLVNLQIKKGEDMLTNHYLLLMAPGDQPVSGIDDHETSIQQGKMPDKAFCEAMEKQGVVIVDPSLQRVVPLTEKSLSDHMLMLCSQYGYWMTGDATISLAEQFQKNDSLSEKDISLAKRQTRRLLPLAVLLWHHGRSLSMSGLMWHLKGMESKPADLCPNTISKSVPWSICALHCIPKVFADYEAVEPLGKSYKTNDFDVLACYRSSSEEYVSALKHQAEKYLRRGRSVEQCLEAMSSTGFFGDYEGESRDSRRKPYRIPAIDAIDPKFWNRKNWRGTGKTLLKAIGVDIKACKRSVGSRIAQSIKGKDLIDGTVSLICQDYRHLWNHRPEIKPAITLAKSNMPALVRHLMKEEQVTLSETQSTKKSFAWKPLDTLQVCHAESEHFRRALNCFITQGFEEGLDVKSMAEILQSTKGTVALGYHSRKLLSIELPTSVKEAGFTAWCEEALLKVIADEGVNCPEVKTLLTRRLQRMFDRIDWEKSAETILGNLKTMLSRQPEFMSFAEALIPDFDSDRARGCTAQFLRCLIFYSDFEPPGKVSEALAINALDELGLYRTGSEKWRRSILKQIKSYLREGHTLSYISHKLNNGDLFFKHGATPAIGCPGLRSDRTWSYSRLRTFLWEDGLSVSAMMTKYPKSAECLDFERQIYRHKGESMTLNEGRVIDLMLTPKYDTPHESSRRVAEVARTFDMTRGKARDFFHRLKRFKMHKAAKRSHFPISIPLENGRVAHKRLIDSEISVSKQRKLDTDS